MIKNADTNILSKLSYENFNYKDPITYIPSPGYNQYKVGFIDRYFVYKINDGTIVETSPRDYESVNSNFFSKEIVNWQIRGSEKNKYNGKILVQYGVVEYNKLQITKASKKIPGLQNVLTNYLQFWIGY